jgi:Holliday junction DNA helicase RuvB
MEELEKSSKTVSKMRIDRIMSDQPTEPDLLVEPSLRPTNFDEYPGQAKVKDNLKVYINASLKRGQSMDHVLLHGPPGLGKTSLAMIIAHELGVPFHQTSGPSIDKPGDLAGILAGLEPRSVLFIDEIHRLSIAVEEVLYSAMEDFNIDILVGQGPTARTIKMPLNPFTLIGATTRVSLLSSPFISRFGIQERLEYYDTDSLAQILKRSASLWHIPISEDGAVELASRSRGTPRIANRLLRRARDFADFKNLKTLDREVVDLTLTRLDIDKNGLDRMDRKILQVIAERYDGGPVGLDTLAATVGEEKATIEEVYEPFLVHQGFLIRGPRGRELSMLGRNHIASLS